MKRVSGRGLWMLVGAALLFGLASAAAAQDGLTSDAVAKQVAERFGVDVLRVAEGEADGRAVYVVTVMNRAGDYDGAFQVTRLMVDRSTGELVSQFRHEAAGYQLPGGEGASGGAEADGRAIRRMSNKESSAQSAQ